MTDNTKTPKITGIENPYGDILIELEKGLSEHAHRIAKGIALPYEYTNEHFRACLAIFMNALTWGVYSSAKDKSVETVISDSEKLGSKLKELILEFTGIDTYKL